MVIRVIPDMPVRSPNNTVESIPNHHVRCHPSAALAPPRRYHRRCSDVQAQRGTSRRASRPIAGRCRCERCLGDRGQGVFCQRSPNRSQGVGHMSWFRVASRADDRRRVQLRFAGPRRVIAIGSWCRYLAAGGTHDPPRIRRRPTSNGNLHPSVAGQEGDGLGRRIRRSPALFYVYSGRHAMIRPKERCESGRIGLTANARVQHGESFPLSKAKSVKALFRGHICAVANGD
jgi:hypothetical protein